jgi:hypothetical protein
MAGMSQASASKVASAAGLPTRTSVRVRKRSTYLGQAVHVDEALGEPLHQPRDRRGRRRRPRLHRRHPSLCLNLCASVQKSTPLPEPSASTVCVHTEFGAQAGWLAGWLREGGTV